MKINNSKTSQKKKLTYFMGEAYLKNINMGKCTIMDNQNDFIKYNLLLHFGNICKY